jgi:hypothetical protein
MPQSINTSIEELVNILLNKEGFITSVMLDSNDKLMILTATKKENMRREIYDLLSNHIRLFAKEEHLFLIFAKEYLETRGCEVRLIINPNIRWYKKLFIKFFIIKPCQKLYENLGIEAFDIFSENN